MQTPKGVTIAVIWTAYLSLSALVFVAALPLLTYNETRRWLVRRRR